MEKKNKHPFIAIEEGLREELIEKIKQLYNEWNGRNSCEAKYRCEAYKELIELIEKEE